MMELNMQEGDISMNPVQSLEKRCYTVEDLQVILHASRGAVYNLIKSNCFRAFQLGPRGKYRIPKKSFDDWLEGNN